MKLWRISAAKITPSAPRIKSEWDTSLLRESRYPMRRSTGFDFPRRAGLVDINYPRFVSERGVAKYPRNEAR